VKRTSVVTDGLQVRGDGTGTLPEGVERLEYGVFGKSLSRIVIIVWHEPRPTRRSTQDSQSGQLPVEGRPAKELLRGRSIPSTWLRITGGEVRGGRERRMRRRMRMRGGREGILSSVTRGS
jgi:hypothetical protein